MKLKFEIENFQKKKAKRKIQRKEIEAENLKQNKNSKANDLNSEFDEIEEKIGIETERKPLIEL